MLVNLTFSLHGNKSENYDINCAVFREDQKVLISTNRFSMATDCFDC